MQMPPKSSSQQLSPSPCVTKQGDQPQDPVLQNKETNLKIHVQRTLFDNVSRDIEGEKEGDSKRRKTGRQAEGGSDMHTEHAHDGVGHKLLHQVLAHTTHGHQNQQTPSFCSSQTAIRQFSLEGNEHMTTTRSRQLVEVAQSQIPTFLPQERSQPR
jgi:hypothetical protein